MSNRFFSNKPLQEHQTFINSDNNTIFRAILIKNGTTTDRYPEWNPKDRNKKFSFGKDVDGNPINQINYFNENLSEVAKHILVSREGPSWEQVGQTLRGGNNLAVSQRLGDQKQLAISGDGNTIILSTKEKIDESGNKIGGISVYIYNKIFNEWEQRGHDILNENVIEGDYELPVNISHDGLKIVIGNSKNNFEGIFFRRGQFRSYIWRLFTHEDENKFHHECILNDQT